MLKNRKKTFYKTEQSNIQLDELSIQKIYSDKHRKTVFFFFIIICSCFSFHYEKKKKVAGLFCAAIKFQISYKLCVRILIIDSNRSNFV